MADRLKAALAELFESERQRALGARELRSKGDVEVIAGGLQPLAGALGLLDALFGQIRVLPSGEEVLEVPVALAVTKEDEGARHDLNGPFWVR